MFVVIGIVGAVSLLSLPLVDDLFDGRVPDLDVMSGPVIGAFLAALALAAFGLAVFGLAVFGLAVVSVFGGCIDTGVDAATRGDE